MGSPAQILRIYCVGYLGFPTRAEGAGLRQRSQAVSVEEERRKRAVASEPVDCVSLILIFFPLVLCWSQKESGSHFASLGILHF